MSRLAPTDHAEALIESLPYLRRFYGKTIVVKYGGSFMDSPDEAVRNGVARDIDVIDIVHGGAADAAMVAKAATMAHATMLAQ